MPNQVIGIDAAIEQPIERGFDPIRGPTTTRRFKGQRVAILNAKSVFDSAGWTTRTIAGPVWTLEATIGLDTDGTQTPVDTPVNSWELHANVLEKDLLQSDTTLARNACAVNADAQKLRDLFKGTTKFEDLSSGDFTNAEAWWAAVLFSQGVSAQVVYTPVLRHDQTVSNAYQIPNSLANVGNVLLSTTLASQEFIPANIGNNLPASGAVVTVAGFNRRYGWLKCHPTIVNQARSKTTISQEWQWGLWSADLYTVL